MLFFAIGALNTIHASPNNVLECIENNLDCEEELEGPQNEQESNLTEDSTVSAGNGSMLFELVKMFFALVLVLALIYLLLKFLSKRNKMGNKVKALENMGGISLGQNKSVQIMRIGSRLYLLGVGENVELLEEITDEEVIKDILHHEENETNDFSANTMLTSLLPSKTEKEKNSTNQTDNRFNSLFSNELEKLKQTRKNLINQQAKKEDRHE
ncbi:flagellar biosynthetic protein FliO [Virgibacillus ainsalahensis]